ELCVAQRVRRAGAALSRAAAQADTDSARLVRRLCDEPQFWLDYGRNDVAISAVFGVGLVGGRDRKAVCDAGADVRNGILRAGWAGVFDGAAAAAGPHASVIIAVAICDLRHGRIWPGLVGR